MRADKRRLKRPERAESRRRRRASSAYFFGDGEEFVGVAAHGLGEVIVGGGDEDAMEGGVVALQVVVGHAGEALPAYGVAFAGEGRAADEAEVHGQLPILGEIYEDVEGAGDAFAVAGQVAGPGLLDPPPPGGVVAQAYQGCIARVALVELQGEAIGPAFSEALHQGGRGALGL